MQLNLRNPLVFFDLRDHGYKYRKGPYRRDFLREGLPKWERRNEDTPDKSRYAYSPRIYRYSWHNR